MPNITTGFMIHGPFFWECLIKWRCVIFVKHGLTLEYYIALKIKILIFTFGVNLVVKVISLSINNRAVKVRQVLYHSFSMIVLMQWKSRTVSITISAKRPKTSEYSLRKLYEHVFNRNPGRLMTVPSRRQEFLGKPK